MTTHNKNNKSGYRKNLAQAVSGYNESLQQGIKQLTFFGLTPAEAYQTLTTETKKLIIKN